MQPPTGKIRANSETLTAALSDRRQRQIVKTAVQEADGDWPQTLERLKASLPEASVQRVALAQAVASVVDGHVPLVRALVHDPAVTGLRDVAVTFDVTKLAALVDPKELPEEIEGATVDERKRNFAIGMRRRLFEVEPTAVLQRMVQDAEIPVSDSSVRSGVVSFLDNQPAFNLRTTSVYQAFRQPEAFKDIAPDIRPAVAENLKTLQRVQAISPVPEAVPHLIEANLTSALSVAQLPESAFVRAHAPRLGEQAALDVYTNAVNAHIRNESALMRMRDTLRGSGLAVIDGEKGLDVRLAELQEVADSSGVPLNLSDLFGSLDYCACEDCQSVYSPAAYFVDLLQYLRNNNLQPGHAHADQAGIDRTPLQMLLRRRPDLGCLELTCENTFTVLPYIDLVNEVMESFVAHAGSYHADGNDPKQATIDVFNVDGATTSELLGQPQHVNYEAYCALKNAVYPFTLPYHQPIDAARIWLKAFKTSRHELLDVFRTATETCNSATLTSDQLEKLRLLHASVIDRAVDAEYLGLTQEEYIILTREAFWPKAYFDLTMQTTLTVPEYEQKIGVQSVHEYFGYGTEADMLSLDEDARTGLTFVKEQFLPRTGIRYPDLVELLRTRYINPAYPIGKALTLMNAVQFSYRFLQALVDTSSSDPTVRFAKLVEFLNTKQTVVPRVDALLHPDPYRAPTHEGLTPADFTNWVHCYFDRVGKLIVLDSGEGPRLPIEGSLWQYYIGDHVKVGYMGSDGTIVDDAGALIGSVNADGIALDINDKPFPEQFDVGRLDIRDEDGLSIGTMKPDGSIYMAKSEERVTWTPAWDTCDLSKVRLVHLDGSPVAVADYDRIHRFIRLWRKMAWTIQWTDQALVGLSPKPTGGAESGKECGFVGLETFRDDCIASSGTPDTAPNCPDIPPAPANISADLLHQLVAVRKALDLSTLPVEKLLTFWADIATTGEAPLYSRLFLTHNLLSIDKVFTYDPNGNVLTTPTKLYEHRPVVMAALKLTAEDIAVIATYRQLPDTLTLHGVSALYRHALLAKLLHVKVSDLPAVFTVFGDPFANAEATRKLLQDWRDMEDAGFTFRQLDYVIRDHDDPRQPLAPSQRTILQTAKILYDGLTGIDHTHRELPADAPDEATDDLVQTNAALLFEQPVVEQILGLLDGTTIYSTNAPAGLPITIPDSLATVLRYSQQSNSTPPTATVQATGILTDTNAATAKGLSSAPDWAKAIDRLGKQPRRFFTDTLSGLFPNTAEAQQQLLAGDVNPPPDPQNPATLGPTAPTKRLYFLRHFIPYLRKRLAHKFIVDTMSTFSGLNNEMTDALLSTLLHTGTPPQSALSALEKIKEQPATGTNGWKGYLIPPVSDSYILVAINSDTRPAPISLFGIQIPFSTQQDDPSNVWWTDPITLKAGTLGWLDTNGLTIAQLQWKTATSAPAPIPAAALLLDLAAQGTADICAKVTRAALLLNGFTLSTTEATHLQSHQTDFDGFDFNALTIQQWRRLRAYCTLRDDLPQVGVTLLDLFGWASQPAEATDTTVLRERLAEVTLWDKASITSLLSAAHFDLDSRAAFRNEVNLVKLQKAIKVGSRTGASTDRLFAWANATSAFWFCHGTATEMQATLRARYDQTDWEQVVKPLYDQLRENQKSALISYLLVQPDLREWGVVDADSLFEFFLIDVQMSACLETSRIKQAISTVQSFVQRCLLGLETHHGVAAGVLDRHRWDWMQKYRVWEANRKVFLYPENWLRSELRDDKSPFFEQLESELLQKDIDPRTVEDALRAYVIKVDEVANLQVAGIYLETPPATTGAAASEKLHIFARTRNVPHTFYYRHYTLGENWYPWERIDVDIPSYDVETTNAGQAKVTGNGTYLIPVVWQDRVLIFFPQFLRKTASPPVGDTTFNKMGEGTVSSQQSLSYWEIKLAWSECRNGKWTQKQLSPLAVYEPNPTSVLPAINDYEFVPRVVSAPDDKIVIDVYREAAAFGAFQFSGSQLFVTTTALVPTRDVDDTKFHYLNTSNLHSLQGKDKHKPEKYNTTPFFKVTDTEVVLCADPTTEIAAYHRFAHDLLGTLNTGTLDSLFHYYSQRISTPADKADAYGRIDTPDGKTSYHELKMPYALYNWEAAFHTPVLLADRLVAARQYDAALTMLQHVLDPFAAGTDKDPVWRFSPFRELDPKQDLEQLFLSLKPNKPDTNVNEWRSHPFQPHVVARGRPTAYMKWVAMKYIQTWIDYGDYYFRQNTLETLPLAIQCYVVAAHLYGPSGEQIPKRGHTLPQTYNSLLDKWDAFGNAIVELELAFPFSNQTSLATGSSNGAVGLANVFGFATTLYFCIPDNPQLSALRKVIDDRLFNIRHCRDIQGVPRKLPLFEPPIDPSLLVQAAAQGLSLSSVLSDLNSPMPNFRFLYQLQKALELCADLKSLGGSFLSAKEKGDAEALAQLRATHESSINTLVMKVRTQQLDEATKALEALQESRKAPVYRLQHQLKLIGEDLAKVPTTETDFSELPEQIEEPVDHSGLKLIPFEKEEIDKAASARDWQLAVGIAETLASVFHVIPAFGGHGTPIGVGTTVTWGGSNLGSASQAVARGLQVMANEKSYESTSAGRKAGFLRQLQERVQQANIAGYEIKNIDRQVLTQQIRIAMAQQEIANQQKQIDNAKEMQDYLQNKYTNTELYSWMNTEIRSLYYQAYTMAYDLAKKAEKLFRFERGLTTSDFIQFGYWDGARDGLLAGERLYHGLKQLEAAYQEKRGHDYEVTKSISLRQLNPMALLTLRETGRCEFTVPEVLFDMDFPGHYLRRIKTVSVHLPAVVGPYTSLNCTLRLLEHKYRNSALAQGANDYPEKTGETDDRFTTVNVPITSIAVSSLDTDAGVFDLNFRDDRYLPFEGAGAISKWRIELPDQFRQFDYHTISDVVLRLRYTAMDGGDKLKTPAADTVEDYIGSVENLSRDEGLFAVFDVKHDFPDEWYAANHPAADATERVLTIEGLTDKLPIFTKGRPPAQIQATDVYVYVSAPTLTAASLTATQGGTDISFTDGPAIGGMKALVAKDLTSAMDNLQLTIADTTTQIDKLWVLERYTLL